MSVILVTYLALPLLAAVLMLPLGRLNGRLTGWLSVLVSGYLFVQTIALYAVRPFNFVILYRPLTLAVTLTTATVSFYAVQYLKQYTGRSKYHTLYMLMLAGMCGVVLAGDLVSLFIFMELAAISTYALVAFGLWLHHMAKADARERSTWPRSRAPSRPRRSTPKVLSPPSSWPVSA